jgi:hypothetical protein
MSSPLPPPSLSRLLTVMMLETTVGIPSALNLAASLFWNCVFLHVGGGGGRRRGGGGATEAGEARIAVSWSRTEQWGAGQGGQRDNGFFGGKIPAHALRAKWVLDACA